MRSSKRGVVPFLCKMFKIMIYYLILPYLFLGGNTEHCDVAIVGGGIAGLYMAESLLRHKKETNVCLFEKSQRLGGRIYDHVFPQVPDVAVGELCKESDAGWGIS